MDLREDGDGRNDDTGKTAIINNTSILWVSIPYFLTHLSYFLINQMNILLTRHFLTKEDVALFGVLFVLILVIQVPILIIEPIISPSLAEYDKANKCEM